VVVAAGDGVALLPHAPTTNAVEMARPASDLLTLTRCFSCLEPRPLLPGAQHETCWVRDEC